MVNKVWMRKVAKATAKPEFQEWLAQMDTELESFFKEDAPDNFPLESPFSPEAFGAVSQQIVDKFPDFESFWDDPDFEQYRERLLRYYGTVWVKRFEGDWINVPAADEDTDQWNMGPAVRLPFFALYFLPHNRIRAMLHRAHPDIFSTVYKNMVEDLEKWVSNGRPTPT